METKAGDKAMVHGRFCLIVRRNGRIIEEIDDSNMVVGSGKAAMASLLGGSGEGKSVAQIAIGTNGVSPSSSDAAITNAFAKDISSVSYPASGQVCFTWSIGASEANGTEIAEFGLLCEDGTLFARKVRAGALVKDSDITLEGNWTISF